MEDRILTVQDYAIKASSKKRFINSLQSKETFTYLRFKNAIIEFIRYIVQGTKKVKLNHLNF